MIKRLNEWLVIEDKPIAGLDPRILAMACPASHGRAKLAVIDACGQTAEIILDFDTLIDLQSAIYQSYRKAKSIEELKEKLKSEGLCEHGWTQGNCGYEECKGE